MMKYLGGIALLLISLQTPASLVLQGTRVIFPSDRKMVSIQMTNYSEQPTLTQSWIDEGNINSTPETTSAPFIVTPPINKIAANEGVQLRIRFLGNNLPMDRESVYYLNVLDIAPKPKNTQGMNTLQLAIQTRIKVFYRPISLLPLPDTLLDNAKFYADKGLLTVNNPTPYFLSIANIYTANNANDSIAKSLMIAPFSTQIIPSGKKVVNGENITVVYIDDTGQQIAYQAKL
ncbi:fimbrial biogenesis chaperone [Providencia rettgeri]|uniref:fimbrial biogenesis chaperone n=1 Tax=Providencia sp. TaxID=589 RepID=UPI0033406E7D